MTLAASVGCLEQAIVLVVGWVNLIECAQWEGGGGHWRTCRCLQQAPCLISFMHIVWRCLQQAPCLICSMHIVCRCLQQASCHNSTIHILWMCLQQAFSNSSQAGHLALALCVCVSKGLCSCHSLVPWGAMAPKGGIKKRLGLARSSQDTAGQDDPMPPEGTSHRARSRSRDRNSGSDLIVERGSSSSSGRPLTIRDGTGTDLRAVVRDLFLGNVISAVDAARLARGGQESGSSGVDDLAAAGARGQNKNTHRDLIRSFLKGCQIPNVYLAKVPLWTQGHQEEFDFPLLLPHEVLAHLKVSKPSLLEQAMPAADALPELAATMATLERQLGTGPGLLPLGLHGDGVPYSKRQSLEVLSWNLPANPLWERVVFAVVPKKFCCQCGCKGKHTWDAILQVFAWSARSLVLGVQPLLRHDGLPLDKARQKLAGKAFGFKAALVQVRGDWPFLKQLFHFPAWNSTRMCWKCNATQDTFKVCHEGAPWRATRVTAAQFLQDLLASGTQPSPLLSCPGFHLDFVCIDWLHTVDLGVAQDVLGNLFWEALSLEVGSRARQLQALWEKVQEYYRRQQPASKLDALTLEMLRQPGKSPKLKAKGGETRYLVPFAAELAQQCFVANPTRHWEAVSSLVQLLLDLYKCIATTPFQQGQAAAQSRKFCTLYQALASEAAQQGEVAWVQKPKLHLMQELLEYCTFDLGSPQNFWTYRDESWVGWLGKAAHRRGGQDTPVCAASRALQRYRALASAAEDFRAD